MITTFIPIIGSGENFFSSKFNLVNQTLHESMLHSNILLLSDEIFIDKLWSLPYEELNSHNLPQYRLIKHLIERGVVREIDPKEILHKEECELTLKKIAKTICRDLDVLGLTPCSDETKSYINRDPLLAIKNIANKDARNQRGATDILDVIFLGITSENICNRVNDIDNSLSFYFHLTKQLTLNEEIINDEYDWIFQVCHQYLPSVPIFQTKTGEEARLESPLEGFFGDLLVVENNKDVADIDSTLRNIDSILSIRNSDIVKDLRDSYDNLTAQISSGMIDYESLPQGNILEKEWHCARVEMNKKMKNINKYEWWTDAMTIPSAIISIPFPIASAVPLLTWTISKFKKSSLNKCKKAEYPWFFTLEQVKLLESEIISNK